MVLGGNSQNSLVTKKLSSLSIQNTLEHDWLLLKLS